MEREKVKKDGKYISRAAKSGTRRNDGKQEEEKKSKNCVYTEELPLIPDGRKGKKEDE